MISTRFLISWSGRACARASRRRRGGVRRGATCWASRRFILGFLAIQRVDGPSLAMLTHPSNSSSFLGVTRPGPLSCRAGHLAGVFFVTPRRVLDELLVRAATRMRKATGASLGRALGHDSTERRRRGIPNTLTSSGSGLKQSAFASAFSRLKVVWRRFPFFSRTSLHDLCDESPGAGRGPARPRAKTRRLSRG